MFCWKNLNAHSVEKPRRIRRDIRRLIGPVVELVVTEKPDVGHKDSRIDVDSMQCVEVVAAVCLRNIPVRIVEVPLTTRRTSVVARRRLRIETKLCHQSRAYVVIVEVTAHTELRYLDFAVPEDLARSANRVILGMVATGV